MGGPWEGLLDVQPPVRGRSGRRRLSLASQEPHGQWHVPLCEFSLVLPPLVEQSNRKVFCTI